MIDPDKRKAIFLLHTEGMTLREISRRLHVSRKTVRKIIQHELAAAPVLTVGDAARALMDVRTSRVQRQPVAVDVRMAGKVDYDETRVATIAATAGAALTDCCCELLMVWASGRHIRTVWALAPPSVSA